MVNLFTKRSLLVALILLLCYSNVLPQGRYNPNMYEQNRKFVNGFRVAKGNRPPIDLDAVSEQAYEPGKLLIKFQRGMNEFLNQSDSKSLQSPYYQTGNLVFDKLHQKYGVTHYKQILDDLYEIDPSSKTNRAKYQAWDFDLWYEVTLDNGSNIKKAVADFLELKGVEKVEPMYKKRRIEPVDFQTVPPSKVNKPFPNDQHFSLQWSLKNTGQSVAGSQGVSGVDLAAEEAWEIEKGNADVIVSVHDGGVQFNHPDLNLNMWEDIGPDGGATSADNHGTHVAGTIAAVTNNSIGIAGVAGGDGTQKGVSIMSVDIFNGRLQTPSGYLYAANHGSSISQNSWGYKEPNVYNSPDLNGIDYFNANGGGIALLDGGIVIFAAGNDNDTGNWYPGCYEGVIGVASHTNKGVRSGFSNYGSWVDISAPGTNIYSCVTQNQYSYMSGTSMACPHVSGVAALVVSKYFSEITKDQLGIALLEGVEDIYLYNPSAQGRLGTGRTSALRALEEADRRFYPKVETIGISDISAFDAKCNGRIVRDGGIGIISKGIIWSNSNNPTLEDNLGFTDEGGGSSDFTSDLSGLDFGTLYYVRTYATNSEGTSYGSVLSFYTFSKLTIAVVDYQKDPIVNAQVMLREDEQLTDEYGLAVFYKPIGTYRYTVEATGFEETAGNKPVLLGANDLKLILLSGDESEPKVIIEGEVDLCVNSEAFYHVNGDAPIGKWEVTGGSITQTIANSQVLISWASSSVGNYVLYRIIENDYNITFKKSVEVDANRLIPPSSKPVIHKKGDIPILICTTPDVEYTWYMDGELIESENKQHYAPRGMYGNFRVMIIDHQHCPNISNEIFVRRGTSNSVGMAAYPNPTDGHFTVSFTNQNVGQGVITVANLYGNVVYQEGFYKSDQELTRNINIPGLPKGVYIVTVVLGNETPVQTKITIN